MMGEDDLGFFQLILYILSIHVEIPTAWFFPFSPAFHRLTAAATSASP